MMPVFNYKTEEVQQRQNLIQGHWTEMSGWFRDGSILIRSEAEKKAW